MKFYVVWKELEKENKEFFEAYNKKRGEAKISASIHDELEMTRQRIHNIMLDSSSNKDSNDKWSQQLYYIISISKFCLLLYSCDNDVWCELSKLAQWLVHSKSSRGNKTTR